MLDRSAVGQLSSLSSRTKWQRWPAGDTLCSVSAAGNRCHFVLLDKDESYPTADLSSNIFRPSGLTYSTGELLNTTWEKQQDMVETYTSARTAAEA